MSSADLQPWPMQSRHKRDPPGLQGDHMNIAKVFQLLAAIIATLSATTYPVVVASQENTESAAAAARSVTGQVLTSTALPAVRLEFDEQFKYVGQQSFVLYGVAHAEQHFFVDADAERRIKRLYWIQFEGYLPSNSHSYQYKINKQVNLGGLTFIADTFARSSVGAGKDRKDRPDSDLGKAEAFLESKGYRIERNSLVLQRLVHLIGAARRDELMIIYAEDLGEPVTAADLNALADGLVERAARNMTILR
jgi:hypothetical protein